MGLLSPRTAAASAFRLFCTPYTRKPKKHKAPPVFHKAEKLSLEIDGLTVRGFHWQPETPLGEGAGKKVLVVHGFSSYAFKFENYVHLLRKAGYAVYLFDAHGHGTSDGKTINAVVYKQLLLRIEALYGPFYGIIGHSLGALAASLAMEEMPDNEQHRLVLVAPATETSRAIRQYCRLFQISEAVQLALEQIIENIARQPVSYFSVNRAVRQLSVPVLWIHDKQDRICPYKDTLPTREQHLPTLEFLTTDGLGHNKIYRDKAVTASILRFLANP